MAGKKGGVGKPVPLLNPQQMSTLSQALTTLQPALAPEGTLGNLLQPFNEGQFNQQFERGVADPQRRFLMEQVLPSIQQRFTNIGGGGSLERELARAAKESTGELGELRARSFFGAQQGQQGLNLQALLGTLSGTTGQTQVPTYRQAQPGFLQSLAPGIGQGVGLGFGSALGGAMSDKLGGLFGGAKK